MKTQSKIILSFAIAITTLNLGAQVVSPVMPAKIEGHTYAEWSERWWQWVFSLPVTQNPLFDNADVSTGQHDNVWFLGGSFTQSTVTRTVAIPHNKLLFFPIINAWEDDTYCNDDGTGTQRVSFGESLPDLRSDVQAVVDTAQNVSCTIDGVDVPGLSDAPNSDYRVKTSSPDGFNYDLPGMNNFLSSFIGLPCWSSSHGPVHVDAHIYHPVGDGIYIMLGPLATGSHVLHFHGEGVSFGTPFTEDITYNITVMK
ncbi:MAG TPA: hypothetical protein VLK27_09750 [Chthoniobacterales bacterium]|nr:hypothetical protein [Chthoniobacterales bacterium]